LKNGIKKIKKGGSMDKYKIPYQGSKQEIAHKIFDIINKDFGNTNDLFATNKTNKIYDLFCGGGAVGYYFYTKGYNVIMNDFNKSLIDLHIKLHKKEISTDLLYKWIDRDEFFELIKRDDWYGALIRQCWSFGNNGKDFLFGKNIESIKKEAHLFLLKNGYNGNKNKRIELIKKFKQDNNIKKIFQLQNLQQLERLERLEQLEQLERLEQLESNIKFYSKNYWEIEIENDSIIYCDPPYINTTKYLNNNFDFNKFDDWVRDMANKGIRVYISEYTNHNNEWREIGSINKRSLMDNSAPTKTIKQEKIFCNI
jgi:site-specific DNA-adenine methylase